MGGSGDPSPFFFDGGPVGALLIHGFTGAPAEMRLMGEYMHERGLTVSGPLLPGHGTTAEDLNRCHWQDWTAHVTKALADLRGRCETVFAAGLSMGALLTLYLAAHNSDLAGIITCSPGLKVADWRINLLPVVKYLVRQFPQGEGDYATPEAASSHWYYDTYPTWGAHELLKLQRQTRPLLPQVKQPLLIIYSTADRAIHPDGVRRLYDEVGSADKELITLHDSSHVITVDAEWELVAEKSYEFIQQHLPEQLA